MREGAHPLYQADSKYVIISKFSGGEDVPSEVKNMCEKISSGIRKAFEFSLLQAHLWSQKGIICEIVDLLWYGIFL